MLTWQKKDQEKYLYSMIYNSKLKKKKSTTQKKVSLYYNVISVLIFFKNGVYKKNQIF
jgi:hypothetical protein